MAGRETTINAESHEFIAAVKAGGIATVLHPGALRMLRPARS
jgi:hypothetical protein